MVAANETRDGMEDFAGEVLHGTHIDCATQLRESSRDLRLRWRIVLSLQEEWNDAKDVSFLSYSLKTPTRIWPQPYVPAPFESKAYE